MTTHELKCLPHYFAAVAENRKPFELRRDDRIPSFAFGDTLRLREWREGVKRNPEGGFQRYSEYTGRECVRRVTYVLRECADFGLMPGYCILGLEAPQEADMPSAPVSVADAFAVGPVEYTPPECNGCQDCDCSGCNGPPTRGEGDCSEEGE